jgi:hypothetical protein
MKEIHEIFDFVGLENVSEGGHGSTTIVDLMLDFLLAQAFSDGAQIWPKISATPIWAVAMLTSLFVK